jgi:hypothetical protein
VSSTSDDKRIDQALGSDVITEGLEGLTCEWCGDPADLKIPKLKKIKGKKVGKIATGMSIIACKKHERIAREIALQDG